MGSDEEFDLDEIEEDKMEEESIGDISDIE